MKKYQESYQPITNSNLVDKILWMNGIHDKNEYKKLETKSLNDYDYNFEGTTNLKNLLSEAKEKNKTVYISYDYDGDGVSGGTILSEMCKILQVNYKMVAPDRFKYGFGLPIKSFEEQVLSIDNSPFLLLTVDLGGKNKSTFEKAKEVGCNVVCIDHHDWEEGIENLCVFINPHFEKNFPFQNICGAMTAFLVAREILKGIATRGQIKKLLEYASIATITDVMPLEEINRSAVKSFIDDVKKSYIRSVGVKSIINAGKITCSKFNASDIGFKIGPMLNAPGRLTSAKQALDVLVEEDSEKSDLLATGLVTLNEKRKKISKELLEKIITVEGKTNVFAFDNAPEGIIGILASNVTEKTGAPSFVFTKTEKGMKGSGRSPIGFNLIENVTEIFKQNPNLVVAYGGHSGAMGLTLVDEKSVERFKELLEEKFKASGFEKEEKYYLEFPFQNKPEIVWNEMELLEPYGEGLKKPIFHIRGYINRLEYIKDTHSKFYVLTNFKEKYGLNMLFFNNIVKEQNKKMDIYFTLEESSNGLYGSVIEMKEKA